MNEKQPDAALRIWLDEPDLMVRYERRGITILTIGLRKEAAKAAVTKFNEILQEYSASGDPDAIEILSEILDMSRETLNGSPGQLLPLDGDDASPFNNLFGEVS